jgi:hypothetical protein
MDSIYAQLRLAEEALLNPDVRRDRAQVAAFLAEDFLEFGSSGRVWTRDQIFELLATETYVPLRVESFECSLLSADVALATYRTVREDGQSASLRSSIWIKIEGRWQLRFHQGTRSE